MGGEGVQPNHHRLQCQLFDSPSSPQSLEMDCSAVSLASAERVSSDTPVCRLSAVSEGEVPDRRNMVERHAPQGAPKPVHSPAIRPFLPQPVRKQISCISPA